VESPPHRIGLPVVAQPEILLYQGDLEADLRAVARSRLAEVITGGLSIPSKMPCPAWGISAFRCRVGQILARREGTVCHDCYAMKGTYGFSSVQDKLEQRYRGLFDPLWVPAMVFLIRWHAEGHFRWFDSGDVQNVRHLQNIITICRHTRDVLHWLPTREFAVVRACADEIPENLTVRVSGHQLDGEPPDRWPTTSTVTSVQEAGDGICPAPEQGGKCGECRACWDREVARVTYRQH